MKRITSSFLAILLTTMLGIAHAADEQTGNGQPQGTGNGQPQGNGWHQFKQDMKEAGRNIGQTGKEIGLGVAKGAKEGSKAVKEYFAPDSSSEGKKGDNAK